MSSVFSPSAVAVDDSHQLRTERLWNAAHESGFRFGEFVLLDKVLPRIFVDNASVAFYDIFRPIEWFDKAVEIIHYHSEELTNKIVDYDFMKAALKVAGFELATNTDCSYFPLGWKEDEGDVHFLRDRISDFSFDHHEYMANRTFKKTLSADWLIPKYTQDVLKHDGDGWLDIHLGERSSVMDDLPDNGHLDGLDAVQCYSEWLDGRRDFDWIIEYYLNSRVRRKRRSS